MEAIHHLAHLNVWAILVSALAQWILGAIWYSPALFAKPWMALLKLDPNGPKKGLAFGMISSFIGSLILSFMLLHIIVWSNATTLHTGLFVGMVCWLGFIACPNFAQGIYEQRPFKLFAINSGYWLVCLLISGPLLALWR